MNDLGQCPVCESRAIRFFAYGWDSEYKTIEGRFRYDLCDRCRLVFLNPPPVELLKVIYPPNYYSFTSYANRAWLHKIKLFLEKRKFKKILRDIPGDRLVALDVGGGGGWMLSVLKACDARISETDEVDIDESARAAAEGNGHIFHCQRIEDFVTEKKFDFILLLNILEHVADPASLMRQLETIISSSGLILIKTPNTDTLDRYLFQNHNWGGLHCPRHWVLFNASGLRSLAERCGFEVVSLSYTQGAPQWTTSILGFLEDQGLISVTKDRPMHTHPLFGPIMALTAAFDFFRSLWQPTAQVFCLLRRVNKK